MSGLQTVIDRASSIELVRRKLAGQTVSRSGRVLISSVASNVPFQFIIDMAPGLRYSTNRDLVEEIDRMDRIFTQTVNIGSTNPGLSYITRYQGDFNSTQLGQITVDSASNLTITLDMTGVTGDASGDVVFKAGDFIQLDSGYKYPYTVTEDVTRGLADTIDVSISRPFIEQDSYTVSGKGIQTGTDVTFNVVMTRKPSYSIVPYDLLQFNSQFELVEVIED